MPTTLQVVSPVLKLSTIANVSLSGAIPDFGALELFGVIKATGCHHLRTTGEIC